MLYIPNILNLINSFIAQKLISEIQSLLAFLKIK